MTEIANVKINLNKLEKVLRDSIARGLASSVVKAEVEKATVVEIEKAVEANQNLFRPDVGPGGGDELVGQLGIGQDGRPLKERYAGSDAAWRLLNPIRGNAARGGVSTLSSRFDQKRVGKFGVLNYTINLDSFFTNFRSVYLGSSSQKISWMQNLIDGIPIAQLVEFPPGVTGHAFVNSGPDFNPDSSRTGLGHMVALERLKIPSQQFTFAGRGRASTFGKLLSDIERRLSSSRYRKDIEKRIAASINRGAR